MDMDKGTSMDIDMGRDMDMFVDVEMNIDRLDMDVDNAHHQGCTCK
jgi:hypothetical protein